MMNHENASSEIDVLRSAIVKLVADSPADPLLKPFGVLLAAAHVAQFAAETNEPMRIKLAQALTTIVRGLAPELVVMLDRPDDTRAH